jgi:hypothetical protein
LKDEKEIIYKFCHSNGLCKRVTRHQGGGVWKLLPLQYPGLPG